MFDFEAEHEETQTKLVGKRHPGEVVGVGGDEGLPQDGATSINFSDLREKSLGHSWSILDSGAIQLLKKILTENPPILRGQ